MKKFRNRKIESLNNWMGLVTAFSARLLFSKEKKVIICIAILHASKTWDTTRDFVEWEKFLLVGRWAKFQKSFKRHFSIVRNFLPNVIFVKFCFEFIFGDEKHFRWFVGFIPTYVNNWKMRGRVFRYPTFWPRSFDFIFRPICLNKIVKYRSAISRFYSPNWIQHGIW